MGILDEARRQRDAAKYSRTLCALEVEEARRKCRAAAVDTLVSPSGLLGAFALGWFTGAPSARAPGRKPRSLGGFFRRLRRTAVAAITSQRLLRQLTG